MSCRHCPGPWGCARLRRSPQLCGLVTPSQGPSLTTYQSRLSTCLTYTINVKIYYLMTRYSSSSHNIYCWPGYPGCSVVEIPPANAGNSSSTPGLGRFHTPRSNQACARLLSLCSGDQEPQPLKLMGPRAPLHKRSRHHEKPAKRAAPTHCN